MTDTKHPAEVLADTLERRQFLRSPSPDQIGEMLRRIPALESERDRLRAEVARWSAIAAVMEAERNELRADAERYRGMRAAILKELPGTTEAEADADVDANLADHST